MWPNFQTLNILIAFICHTSLLYADNLVLELLDGRSIKTTFKHYDNGLMTQDGRFEFSQLLSVKFPEREQMTDKANLGNALIFYEIGGEQSIFYLKDLQFNGDSMKGRLVSGNASVELPARHVQRISWRHSGDVDIRLWMQAELRELTTWLVRKPNQDQLVVTQNKKSRKIHGIFHAIKKDKLYIELDNKIRSISLRHLSSISTAYVPLEAKIKIKPSDIKLRLHTGETLAGNLVSWNTKNMIFQLAGLPVQIACPIALVSKIELSNQKLLLLSELKPLTVRERTILVPAKEYAVNQNLYQAPININGQTFNHGLAQHADSELTFQRPEQYNWLIGRVGLDDSAEGKGDCVINVIGDDQIIWSRRLHKSQDSQLMNRQSKDTHWYDIKLPVSDYSRITLQVQHGENWDMSDHVSWGMLRYIRS